MQRNDPILRIYIMTTHRVILEYIEKYLHAPVLSSSLTSIANRRRVQTDRMRLRRLPVRSIALYIEHGAACDTPRRLAANERLEQEGFSSYRTLVASMREIFADVWPK